MTTPLKAALLCLVALLVFAGGFLVGRQFPAHHYEKFNNGFMVDQTTGVVCNPYPPSPPTPLTFSETVLGKSENPIDKGMKEPVIPSCGS
jgi:hypothetical protein